MRCLSEYLAQLLAIMKLDFASIFNRSRNACAGKETSVTVNVPVLETLGATHLCTIAAVYVPAGDTVCHGFKSKGRV